MTKNQNEFEPMLKSYQIFILSLLITTLLFLNSNHAHKIRYETKLNQEKGQLFDIIISKRYLDGESSPGSGEENSESSSKIDEVCERGSEELRSYYKTGNLNDIKLEKGNIKCEDKDKDYMKALISIIKSQ